MASLAQCCDHSVLLEMYMRAADMHQNFSLRRSRLCLFAGVLVADDMISALRCTRVCSLSLLEQFVSARHGFCKTYAC